MASQKQLEGTRITRKGHSNTQVPAPTPTMVAGEDQCAPRSTITPSKACSAKLYRRIKRRVGRPLKRTHCKRVLVNTRKEAGYKLSGTKSSLSSFKRVPTPLFRQDCRVIHKQGRRHEVRPTVCLTVENLDLKQVTLKARHIPGRLNVVGESYPDSARLSKQSGLSFQRSFKHYAAGGTGLK